MDIVCHEKSTPVGAATERQQKMGHRSSLTESERVRGQIDLARSKSYSFIEIDNTVKNSSAVGAYMKQLAIHRCNSVHRCWKYYSILGDSTGL